MFINRFGIKEFRAKNEGEVFETLRKQFPNGVAKTHIYYGVDTGKDGMSPKKYCTLFVDGVLGRNIWINISKKTADILVNEYGYSFDKSWLYDKVNK